VWSDCVSGRPLGATGARGRQDGTAAIITDYQSGVLYHVISLPHTEVALSVTVPDHGIRAGWLLAMFLAAGLLSCAGGYHVERHVDDLGTETVIMDKNEIGIEGEREYSDYAISGTTMHLTGVEQYCALDAVRRTKMDGSRHYYLRFSYTGPRELKIVDRRSLKLIFDDKSTATLEGRGEVERESDPMSESWSETFYYAIDDEVLVRLSEADEVHVVVTGSEFELRCYLLERNFDAFQAFVRDYIHWKN